MENRTSTEQFNNKMFKNSWKNISWFYFFSKTRKFKVGGVWVFFKGRFKETLLPLLKNNDKTMLLLRLCLKTQTARSAFLPPHYICYHISLWWDSALLITLPQRQLKSLLTLLITNMNGEEGPEPFHITVSYCSRGNK